MKAAAKNVEAFREQHGKQVSLPEAQHMDNLSKLAVLAAQKPGARSLPPEVPFHNKIAGIWGPLLVFQ